MANNLANQGTGYNQDNGMDDSCDLGMNFCGDDDEDL